MKEVLSRQRSRGHAFDDRPQHDEPERASRRAGGRDEAEALELLLEHHPYVAYRRPGNKVLTQWLGPLVTVSL